MYAMYLGVMVCVISIGLIWATPFKIHTPPVEDFGNGMTAISKMKNGKSGGKDNITVELLKADIEISEEWLEDSFKTIWDSEKVSKSWKQGLIVKIPMKGDLIECGYWRGFTLTAVPSKVFGRVIINRIRDGVENKLRKEQAGFRRGHCKQV